MSRSGAEPHPSARRQNGWAFLLQHIPALLSRKKPARMKRVGSMLYQNARSLFLENFMNSSSEIVVTTSRIVATAAATPSLPCTTEV